MSLRIRVLILFAALGVVPLVGIGFLNYVQSRRAVESLIAVQTHALAERAATEISRRHALLVSDLLLLADNAEVQELFDRGPDRREALTPSVAAFFDATWVQISPSYDLVELRDASGAVVHRLGNEGSEAGLVPSSGRVPAPTMVVEQPIADWESGRTLGTVVARPRLSKLLPREALDARFGAGGYSVVVDRSAGRILYHPRHALMGQKADALVGSEPWPGSGALTDGPAGILRFEESDSLRLASVINLDIPSWSVLAIGSVDEFAAPFARARTVNLLLVLLATAVVAAAFLLAIRRATRSLEELTGAAEEVGRGNFVPSLRSSGTDEVGRLASAFALMTDKVREMMSQVERSRQMAVIGEFAAEIAHEIRNPLTSLKLNQQRLERLSRSGRMPAEAEDPIRISLREARRLERVVRGILHLGRPRKAEQQLYPAGTVVQEAIEVVREQAERQSIGIVADLDPAEPWVYGDPEQLRGALLNLYLNAVEAMPAGGVLKSTMRTSESMLELRVTDTGVGIPPEVRSQLFKPFFSTKVGGTGLGLAIALRTVEEHGGRLTLDETVISGTTFIVQIPLAPAGAPA